MSKVRRKLLYIVLIVAILFSGMLFSACKITKNSSNNQLENKTDNSQINANNNLFTTAQILGVYNRIYSNIFSSVNNTNVYLEITNSRTDYEWDNILSQAEQSTIKNRTTKVLTSNKAYEKLDFDGEITEIWYIPKENKISYDEYSLEYFDQPKYYLNNIKQEWENFLDEQIALFAPSFDKSTLSELNANLSMAKNSDLSYKITLSYSDITSAEDGVGICKTEYQFTIDSNYQLTKSEQTITYLNSQNQPMVEISSIYNISYNNAIPSLPNSNQWQ